MNTKIAIVLLAILGYIVAEDAEDLDYLEMNCKRDAVIDDAVVWFTDEFSYGCAPDDTNYYCYYGSWPKKFYIEFSLNEGYRKFAPALTIHTRYNNMAVNVDQIDCVTCNKTEYNAFDASECGAQTYWTKHDFHTKDKCLADEFFDYLPRKFTNKYYYKLPLWRNKPYNNATIFVDVKVGKGEVVCSLGVFLDTEFAKIQ